MARFAIGDIHGNSNQLRALLPLLQISKSDTLVFLGDYVDKGPDVAGTLEFLSSLSTHSNFVFLRGNHDQSFLKLTSVSLSSVAKTFMRTMILFSSMEAFKVMSIRKTRRLIVSNGAPCPRHCPISPERSWFAVTLLRNPVSSQTWVTRSVSTRASQVEAP